MSQAFFIPSADIIHISVGSFVACKHAVPGIKRRACARDVYVVKSKLVGNVSCPRVLGVIVYARSERDGISESQERHSVYDLAYLFGLGMCASVTASCLIAVLDGIFCPVVSESRRYYGARRIQSAYRTRADLHRGCRTRSRCRILFIFNVIAGVICNGFLLNEQIVSRPAVYSRCCAKRNCERCTLDRSDINGISMIILMSAVDEVVVVNSCDARCGVDGYGYFSDNRRLVVTDRCGISIAVDYDTAVCGRQYDYTVNRKQIIGILQVRLHRKAYRNGIFKIAQGYVLCPMVVCPSVQFQNAVCNRSISSVRIRAS